jgi:flagellar export protein FliJ
MPAFRFRAAAALELRQQQEREAAAALGRAEADVQRAREARAGAEGARQQAQQALLAQQTAGIDGVSLEWHRNWISGLGTAVVRLDEDVERRLTVMRKTEQVWRDARRKRLALERLRERAWRRYQDEEARRERLVIDELARLRFMLGGEEPAREDDREH